ncbi:hypothetical protein DA803_00955 [[Mycoplasma] phocae]|uniref:Lipoprotein n=1 Tax=[Mycoplasma] phocae TaxID=142651 RepID=A0A2Z5IPZ4_9BACT|nr:hypothetical protein [[Mycoplasma] phocae]AXE60660.1 hypothetical protein DA803_00955 [[Mycoplasma] phocae]
MKAKKIFLSFLPIIAVAPLIAVSCTNEKANDTKKITNPRINFNQRVKGYLSTSQLDYIKESFEFRVTKEGRKLSWPERNEIISSLIEKYKKFDNPKNPSSDPNHAYERIIKDEEFTKYFEFKMGAKRNIWGHPLKVYFNSSDSSNVPFISFSIYCPDLGMALEKTDTVKLEV